MLFVVVDVIVVVAAAAVVIVIDVVFTLLRSLGESMVGVRIWEVSCYESECIVYTTTINNGSPSWRLNSINMRQKLIYSLCPPHLLIIQRMTYNNEINVRGWCFCAHLIFVWC